LPISSTERTTPQSSALTERYRKRCIPPRRPGRTSIRSKRRFLREHNIGRFFFRHIHTHRCVEVLWSSFDAHICHRSLSLFQQVCARPNLADLRALSPLSTYSQPLRLRLLISIFYIWCFSHRRSLNENYLQQV